MTITLCSDQEQAVRDAIRASKVTSVDEFIARAIAILPKGDETPSVSSSSSVFAQGLGLFGSPEDASLLDGADNLIDTLPVLAGKAAGPECGPGATVASSPLFRCEWMQSRRR